jgi:hypothetical protein
MWPRHAGDLSVDRHGARQGNQAFATRIRGFASYGGACRQDDSDVQYLRIYVRSLRQKIEADAERPSHILTETGVGYRLREPD